ncbi:MAG: HupE/UreJ family protein [Myxococcota bacterium]
MFSHAVQLGLLLGLRHASDADHVCAVASLLRACHGRAQALRTAAWWSLGHSVSFFSVGLALLLLDLRLPAALESAVELTVAVSLLVLGVSQWRHADCPGHAHPARGRASVLLGLLHGLAGSAGVALLALTTMQDRHTAVVYLVFYGLGTVFGMGIMTLILSWPLHVAGRFQDRHRTWVLRAAAGASIAIATWLLVAPLISPNS